MATVKRSALVMHSAEQMYSLVNDVSSYPEFMDGCIGVEVFEHSDTSMLARLDLKKAGVKISFMTRNKLRAPETIEMTLEDGPFKTFRGLWEFKPLTDEACHWTWSLNLTTEVSVWPHLICLPLWPIIWLTRCVSELIYC